MHARLGNDVREQERVRTPMVKAEAFEESCNEVEDLIVFLR